MKPSVTLHAHLVSLAAECSVMHKVISEKLVKLTCQSFRCQTFLTPSSRPSQQSTSFCLHLFCVFTNLQKHVNVPI